MTICQSLFPTWTLNQSSSSAVWNRKQHCLSSSAVLQEFAHSFAVFLVWGLVTIQKQSQSFTWGVSTTKIQNRNNKCKSCLQADVLALMTSAPPPAPPSFVPVQPATCPKPHLLMWPPAPGGSPLQSLAPGILSLFCPQSSCRCSWSPAWRAGKLVSVLQREVAVASPPGCWHSPQNSQKQWQNLDLRVSGAPELLWGGRLAARPSFVLRSLLQPHRSRRTGLQTWPNIKDKYVQTLSTQGSKIKNRFWVFILVSLLNQPEHLSTERSHLHLDDVISILEQHVLPHLAALQHWEDLVPFGKISRRAWHRAWRGCRGEFKEGRWEHQEMHMQIYNIAGSDCMRIYYLVKDKDW